jgi:hypothetical protein
MRVRRAGEKGEKPHQQQHKMAYLTSESRRIQSVESEKLMVYIGFSTIRIDLLLQYLWQIHIY